MKRGSRHSGQSQQLDFSDFSGGWNSSESAENIEQNELADVLNMTYSTAPGRLRTREGAGKVIHAFSSRIDEMYEYRGVLLIASGGQLFSYDKGKVSVLGALSGTLIPSFCSFGGDLFISSGGKIQKYSPSGGSAALQIVQDSPVGAAGLYMRAGRMFCIAADSDTILGSAVGDASRWTIPAGAADDAPVAPVMIQTGYKIAGNIIGVIPSLTDVTVFKEGVAMRLIGEYPNWSQKEISRDEVLANSESLANVAGYLFYMEASKGIRMLRPTDSYAEIEPSDVLSKANPWIRKELDVKKCRLWNLKARNVLLISTGSNVVIPAYYEYGLDKMPVLKWRFYDEVRSVVEVDRNLAYIAIGNNLHYFLEGQFFEPGEKGGKLRHVVSLLSSKRYRGFTGYLIKRLLVHAQRIPPSASTSPAEIFCGSVKIADIVFAPGGSPSVYGNLAQIYENGGRIAGESDEKEEFSRHNPLRQTSLQIHFQSAEVPFELVNFAVEFNAVGGSV